MTPDDIMAWRIDAWSPVDGLAFASRRLAGIRNAADDGPGLAVESTVFLSPPWFEPEPVGSLATALGATRGPFQTGFFVREREAAFETLADVEKLVRRAYRIGGGFGTPGPGDPLPGAPVPAPEPPEPVHRVSPFTDEIESRWQHLQRLISGSSPPPPDQLAAALGASLRVAVDSGMLAAWAAGSVASIFAGLAQADVVREDVGEAACRWIGLLNLAGFPLQIEVEKSFARVRVVFGSRSIDIAIPGLDEAEPEVRDALHGIYRTFPFTYQRGVGHVMALLQRVPLTPHVAHTSHRHRDNAVIGSAPTLGTLLCLACSDRAFLGSIDSAAAFGPLLVAALCLNTHMRARQSHFAVQNAFHRSTCAWLAKSLAITSLGGDVDAALSLFARTHLDNLDARNDGMEGLVTV